jgi:hypothetical protein
MVLKEPVRDCGSHSPGHGVNSGPTNGVAKKACGGVDGIDGLDRPGHMLMVLVQGL